MSNKSGSNAGTSGVGFSTLLFLTFLVLKLTKVITWSWWWVTSPLWISFGLGVLLLVVCFAIGYKVR